jgi:hypothetical protein
MTTPCSHLPWTPENAGKICLWCQDRKRDDMTESEAEYESVRILRLQPGDVVVVRFADRIDKLTAETIRNDLKPKFPDHEVLVLGPDADLEIVRDGDDEPI